MSITTTQKLIKIGTSSGVTLPAKQLKSMGVKPGDELELVVRKKGTGSSDDEVLDTANAILERYKQDFTNLANR